MSRAAHVFLIPGFFGIANVGAPRYFLHVRRALAAAAEARGTQLHFHEVLTHPTASLSKRAGRLASTVARTAADDDLPIHLIGHSTGAVDARIWLAPQLQPEGAALRWRVRSAVSVCGAHMGTPSAAFFASLRGHQLLRLLSVAAVRAIRGGMLDTTLLRRLANILAPDAPVLLLDQVYSDIVGDLDGQHRQELDAFLSDMAEDGSLLPQLAPESMEVIDSLLVAPPHVRCGSVVAAVPARTATQGGAIGPRYRASMALFSELHRISARPAAVPPRPLTAAVQRRLKAVHPALIRKQANDGLVPVRSQLWEHLVHGAVADHMDVLGHFADPDPDNDHRDWMYSGADFGRADFDALWSAVAAFALDQP